MASCSGCERKWASLSEAHCGSCHSQFIAVAGFDMHRSGGKCWQGSWSAGDFHTDTEYHRCGPSGPGSHVDLLAVADIWGTEDQHQKRARISALGKASRAVANS